MDRDFDILFAPLNPERTILGALCTGVGNYAIEQAVAYACDAALQCVGGNRFTKEYGIFDLCRLTH
ncbi:MAG: acyl-CoA dehydrogenase [Haliea sp.]|nr:acyl-CoA dehydrogenase [Haliea sp.]MBK6737743.1 acyl-CoA dehydrogenase [Haliea sp.]